MLRKKEIVERGNSKFIVGDMIDTYDLDKENARVIETPTINRKKGNIRSVRVQPCHCACNSGG